MGILSRIQAGLEYDAYMRKIIDPPLHGTGQQAIKPATLRAELIPFRSPLLRESHLVSFPPLINMLKFRG
jgi:hypothetical protein